MFRIKCLLSEFRHQKKKLPFLPKGNCVQPIPPEFYCVMACFNIKVYINQFTMNDTHKTTSVLLFWQTRYQSRSILQSRNWPREAGVQTHCLSCKC